MILDKSISSVLLLLFVFGLQRSPSEAFLLRLPVKRSVAPPQGIATGRPPPHLKLARRAKRSSQGARCKIEVQDDTAAWLPAVPSPQDICTDYDCGPSTILGGLVSAGQFQNYTQQAVLLPETYTIAQTLDFIRQNYDMQSGQEACHFEILYVQNKMSELVGHVLAVDLIVHSNNLSALERPIGSIARPIGVVIKVDDDPEDMLRKFRQTNFALRAPLIGHDGQIIGVINPQDILRQQEIENTDDMLRFSGVLNPMRDTPESVEKQSYWKTPIWTHIRHRSAVLTVLLLLQSLSSVVLSSYQGLIERNVFLALFLTMLTGTGGNAGNQSSALIIRGLSTGEINENNSIQVVLREVLTSSVIALLLAIAAFFRVMLTQGAPLKMGLILSFSTYATVVFAVAGGTVVPLALQRAGLDPCNLSSPMLATLTDILGVLLLCVVSSAVLGNNPL